MVMVMARRGLKDKGYDLEYIELGSQFETRSVDWNLDPPSRTVF